MVEAAVVTGVSERQCYRIKAGVVKGGAQGVVHGNRGRPSRHKVNEKTERRIVELARGRYRGFNDHHLTEKHTQGQAWRHCTILHLFRKQGLAPSPGPVAVMHQLGFLKPTLI